MRNIFAAMLLTSLLGVGVARAAPVPGIDVPTLVQESDVIIVGRASSVQETGNGQELALSVDRIIKGNAPTGAIHVKLDRSEPEYGYVELKQYGVFFLHSEASAYYSPADIFHPAVPASPERPALSSSSDPLQEVAEELTQVLNTPTTVLTGLHNGVQHLAADVVLPDGKTRTGPSVQAQEVYADTARALDTLPYDITRTKLRLLATSSKTFTKLWAVNCMVSRGDLQYLDSIKPLLLAPRPDLAPTVNYIANSIELASSRGQLQSPDIIPTMGGLLGSTEVEVRRAAAVTLRQIGTEAVIPALAKALDDADENVRYYAVGGLAKATGSGIPTIPAFRANENKYMEFWRSWASANIR